MYGAAGPKGRATASVLWDGHVIKNNDEMWIEKFQVIYDLLIFIAKWVSGDYL